MDRTLEKWLGIKAIEDIEQQEQGEKYKARENNDFRIIKNILNDKDITAIRTNKY